MEALRERGILIRYLGGALADRVRITIGTPGQMDRCSRRRTRY